MSREIGEQRCDVSSRDEYRAERAAVTARSARGHGVGVSGVGVSASGVRAVHRFPLDVSGERVLSLVERLLEELASEPVGVAYRRPRLGGFERIEYLAVPASNGELFERHQYVPRHEWASETVSRASVREELLTLCHRDEAAQLAVRHRAALESVRCGVALRAWQSGGRDHDGDGSTGTVAVPSIRS
jgi:hypothetical protein